MSAASELRLRVYSSLVLATLAVIATWVGGIFYQLFWLIGAAAIFREWITITHFRIPWVLAGAIYVLLFLVAMILLREGAFGFAAIIWLFGLIWAADTAAFFAGRWIGGPKLWPAVSPNKTWSGSIAGTLAGVLAGLIVIGAFGISLHFVHIVIGLIVVIAAQGGDLLESAIKRRFGAKDSGQIIPGHGGVMDRCDSLVMASVVALLIGLARAWSAPAQGLLLW